MKGRGAIIAKVLGGAPLGETAFGLSAALNPLASRQTISDSQAEPEFQENHKRLRADRQAREGRLKAKGK
jgi:hypothetical protein